MKYRRLYTASPDQRSDLGMEEHVQRYEDHMENGKCHVGWNCG